MMTTRTLLILAVLALLSGPALADMDFEEVNTCLGDRVASGQSPASCIDDVHADCVRTDAGTPAVATLCFVTAEQNWQAGMAGLMETIGKNASEQVAAIAGIEVKYDMLAALLQCNRMEELSRVVGRDSAEVIQRQTARCRASAAGLTYARLFLRLTDLR
jgi:hypothetical protein